MHTLKIVRDPEPIRPDEWGDDDVFLVAFHKQFFVTHESFRTVRGLSNWKETHEVFPLYAYIHSGVSLSLSRAHYPFTDPWDSAQVGYVLIRQGSVPDSEQAAQGIVDEWNSYLSGDVWGWEIRDEDDEIVDSCYGYYERESAEEAGTSELNYWVEDHS